MNDAAPDTYDAQTRAADYARMAGALGWLAEHWRARPSLEEAAAAVGLSPAHFQRTFTRWAGVSPKTFVQALAHAESRRALEGGATLLDAAWDAGLSGPSRLHDLYVAHEAATPGDARRRGEGLAIRYGVAPSPFGRALLAATDRGLCAVGFSDVEGGDDAAAEDLRARWPAADWLHDDAALAPYAARAFNGATGRLDLDLMGPPFHVAVWKALLRIPSGRTASYGAVAAAAGKPGAYRATGAAVGANPISWLIPCHRALASDGRLTGYHWGLPRKAAMLGLEAVGAYEGERAAA
ncbi:MAG: methylated-DNA--[protein]-cysteine S-methyltransferase [Caulobacteraceae bacterium]|nr:methylated-DNA--[protein]-cysteine S-methyltransferase [Caulobacter sp.]